MASPASDEARSRPKLQAGMSVDEFIRWYWTKRELQTFAASLGIGTSGVKAALAARIQAVLSGKSPDPVVRRRSVDVLEAPLTGATVVPEGQRMTAVLRAHLVSECPGFLFDAHMREILSAPGDKTIALLIAHWHATRTESRSLIAPQFEYNAFVRAWRRTNPGSTHAEVVAAWNTHRSLPVEDRPPIG